ncbi:MAG: S41 family peptidase [Patescibacteria group bacterium]
MQKSFNIKNVIAALVFASLFFLVGVSVGRNNQPEIDKVTGIIGKEIAVTTETDFSPFWKVWNTINEKYPKADKITDQDRVYGAISGLIGSLNDPYSVFFTPDEAKSFQEEISGNFSGIGMEVGMKDKVLTVIAPLKNTPAYRANIKPGDKVLKIDDKSTSGMNIEEAIKLIRGEKGTTVALTIYREGKKDPLELKIVRDIIDIPTLDTELRKDGIFVIRLYSFSANSANLFRNAIRDFSTSNTDKLILDLRGNPGGYLDAAVDVASWFLPAGKVVVTEDYGDMKRPEIFRGRGYDIFSDKIKFVILIDGGSASASEIVAGAMQDHGRAKLVGTQSFGKGSVQEVTNPTPNTLLKITVAKWLTPNGHIIAEKGLTPDYVVENKKPARPPESGAGGDLQLDKAVEILLGN